MRNTLPLLAFRVNCRICLTSKIEISQTTDMHGIIFAVYGIILLAKCWLVVRTNDR